MKWRAIGVIALLFCCSTFGLEISRPTAKVLLQVDKLQSNSEYDAAQLLLRKTKPNRKIDEAYLNRAKGVLYWLQEKPIDAVLALEKAVNKKKLPLKEQKNTLIMLADIQVRLEKYHLANEQYFSALALSNTNEEIVRIRKRIIQVFYFNEEWKKVLSEITQLTNIQDIQILSIKMMAEINQSYWERALVTAKQLRELDSGQKMWWQQLVALYVKTNNYKEALAVLQQSERSGIKLTHDDTVLLSQLYAQQGAPARAAETLTKTLPSDKNDNAQLYAQLAGYWQLAKEWSESLESWRQAAKRDKQYQFNYIQALVQQEKYKLAASEYGKIEEVNAENLLAGVQIYYHLNDVLKAKELAKKAVEKYQSNDAKQWVLFLQPLN